MVNFTEEEGKRIIDILMETVDKLSFLWKEDALDGDQTEWISKELLRRLDIINANQ